LKTVFIEPDGEAVAAQYFHKLASRLHIRSGVTEKYVALAPSFNRGRAHLA
jgi:hypothetical protein